MSEYTFMDIQSYKDFPDSQAGYVSLLKKFGDWTPYVTYAFSQPRETGDHSVSLGTSYSITPFQKLKAEVTHVEVGHNPGSLIDMESATKNYGHEKLNVYSLSYNVAF